MNSASQIIMSIAYLFFMSSVLPNVSAVWKNRNKLRGFSRFGVTVTAIGLLLVQLSFVVDSVWIPFLIGFPNMVYWQFVCYFVWKNREVQR